MEINGLGSKVTYLQFKSASINAAESSSEQEDKEPLPVAADTDSYAKDSSAEEAKTSTATIKQDKAHAAYLTAIQQALAIVKNDLK